MDRHIQDNLEKYLHGLDRKHATPPDAEFERQLEAADEETRRLVELMATQAQLLRTLRVADDECEPEPGFYARVLQRIEAQRPASIWSLFEEPQFFHRLAVATFSLLLLLGVTFISSGYLQEAPVQAQQRSEPEMILAAPEPTPVTSVSQTEGRDVMLRQLTVYSE